MEIDARALKPSDLLALLNSTGLGKCSSEKRIKIHRGIAGLRIGDFRKVDLYRYAAWLVAFRRRPREQQQDEYAKQKERTSKRIREMALIGRDIGALPDVVDPVRKAKARGDFRFFCEAYLSKTFCMNWSPDHLRVIGKTEQAVKYGGLFALAMPRGSGKSSIAEAACMWALFYGHKKFVALVGASESQARSMLESIKTELDSNPTLLADFREYCLPIRKLEGIANRCPGQLYKGERTHIGWTDVEIILPNIPDAEGAGGIVRVAGLTGAIRGMKFKRQDGTLVRPDLVVCDDPQTDASARSVSQCASRIRLLSGAVLGLAGPGKKISGIMPCTVIAPGDVADAITDREKHPEWNGEKTKMVYAFPTNEKLWLKYTAVRSDSLRAHGDLSLATDFYLKNRTEMDEGAQIAWPERFNPDEASAVQHAMNLKIQDEASFQAEYQNDPLPDTGLEEREAITPDDIMHKLNGHKRGSVPVWANYLTAFVDVQEKALYWILAAWGEDFTGSVVDYGTYPDQRRGYYTLRDIQRTLAQASKGAGREGAIYAGLDALAGDILAREWKRVDGMSMRIGLCLVDANWGASTNTVYQFCQQSRFAAQLLASHGRYVGAASRPYSEYAKRPGDQVGLNWRIPGGAGKRATRHVNYDTNFWKTFVASRFLVKMGDVGCLSLYGKSPEGHQLLADHLTSEVSVKTEGRNRVVDEWRLRSVGRDNHWLDGMVGSAVAASIVGASLPGVQANRFVRKTRIRLSDLQKARR